MQGKIENIIEIVGGLAKEAINLGPKRINDVNLPQKSGVYIIRHNRDGIIYIGKAKNLKRRIGTDHLSAETSDTMSAFRRSVHKEYEVQFGPKMKEWISDNCSFSYLEIEGHDIYSLVEAILIASFRSNKLLNKPKIETGQ